MKANIKMVVKLKFVMIFQLCVKFLSAFLRKFKSCYWISDFFWKVIDKYKI